MLLAAGLLAACNHPSTSTSTETALPYHSMSGNAQGTTFSIAFQHSTDSGFVDSVEALLTEIDYSMSTYRDNSVILNWNLSAAGTPVDAHFLKVLSAAGDVHAATNGAFDPTVMPLVSLWGFHKRQAPDSAGIDSLVLDSVVQLVGINKVQWQGQSVRTAKANNANTTDSLKKTQPGVQLDCNAIAQGYSVDVLAEFLERQGIANYMVELGGEVRTKGQNAAGQTWKLGIDKPEATNASNRELQAAIQLENKGLATSGNYRKFYVRDGVKYAHTLDPTTGAPVQHSLLSATVVAENAMLADAYATAFMVMGVEQVQAFLAQNNALGAYLIYSDETGELQTWMSAGMNAMVTEMAPDTTAAAE